MFTVAWQDRQPLQDASLIGYCGQLIEYQYTHPDFKMYIVRVAPGNLWAVQEA